VGKCKKIKYKSYSDFSKYNVKKINKLPPYVSNRTLHTDLKIKTIKEEAATYYKRFHNRLATHSNPLVKTLSSIVIPGEKKKRKSINKY